MASVAPAPPPTAEVHVDDDALDSDEEIIKAPPPDQEGDSMLASQMGSYIRKSLSDGSSLLHPDNVDHKDLNKLFGEEADFRRFVPKKKPPKKKRLSLSAQLAGSSGGSGSGSGSGSGGVMGGALARFKKAAMRVKAQNILAESNSIDRLKTRRLSQRLARLIGRRAVGEQFIHQEEPPAPLLSGASRPRAMWDILIICLVLYSTVLLPLQMAEIVDMDSPGWQAFDLIVDVLFWIDLVLNFFTPYQSASGDWITDKKRMALNYLKSWFVIDFLSCLPIDTIVESALASSASSSSSTSSAVENSLDAVKATKMARLVKNFRLLRVARIGKIFARYASKIPNTGQVMRIFAAFVFFTHVCGCIFLFVSNSFPTNDHFPGSWTWQAEIHPQQQPSPGRSYIISTYNALFMLFGTQSAPEMAKQSEGELISVIFILLLGSICHATLYGEMAHLMSELNANGTRKKAKLTAVKQHLRTLGIDNVVADRVLQYYAYVWKVNKYNNREHFLQELSQPLHDEISLLVSGKMVQRVDMFRTMNDACLLEVVKALRQRLYLAGDFIICEGTAGREMYFVMAGRCEVVTKAKIEIILAEFGVGDHFGEVAMAMPNSRRTATVVAADNCDLSALYLDAFQGLSAQFPELELAVQEMAAQRKLQHTELQKTILGEAR